jgi:hypothetical protein
VLECVVKTSKVDIEIYNQIRYQEEYIDGRAEE